MMKEQTLELYVHIPFCKKKCRYCDFLSFAGEEWTQETYTQALIREIGAWKGKENKKVSSVFVGGGTPSILSVRRMEKIFEALRESFFLAEDAEITIECNPGTLEKEKLEVYKGLGVNRLSLGLQSAKNEELRLLGRIHTWETFLESFQMARKAGFENLNVDLISALPGQTVESWRETLEKTIALSPEHISAYSLIIEEGTLFEPVEAFSVFCDERAGVCDAKSGQGISHTGGSGISHPQNGSHFLGRGFRNRSFRSCLGGRGLGRLADKCRSGRVRFRIKKDCQISGQADKTDGKENACKNQGRAAAFPPGMSFF